MDILCVHGDVKKFYCLVEFYKTLSLWEGIMVIGNAVFFIYIFLSLLIICSLEQVRIQQLGPGMVSQVQSMCGECRGQGERINPKDRCKTCEGRKVSSCLG